MYPSSKDKQWAVVFTMVFLMVSFGTPYLVINHADSLIPLVKITVLIFMVLGYTYLMYYLILKVIVRRRLSYPRKNPVDFN